MWIVRRSCGWNWPQNFLPQNQRRNVCHEAEFRKHQSHNDKQAYITDIERKLHYWPLWTHRTLAMVAN
jgi:hypothetical protein